MAVSRICFTGRTWYPLINEAARQCYPTHVTRPILKAGLGRADQRMLLRTTSVVRSAAEGVYEPQPYPEYYAPIPTQKIRPSVQYYKGKSGAVTLNFTMPRWEEYVRKGDNGSAANDASQPARLVLQREGSLLIEFASQIGERTYDWANKGTFALSTVELALLMEYPNEEHKFFHDPGLQTAAQGQTTKTLTFKPNTDPKNGWYVTLRIVNKGQPDRSWGLPFTRGEMAEIKVISHRLIPVMRGLEEAPLQ